MVSCRILCQISIPTFTSNFVLQFASDKLVNSNYLNPAYNYTCAYTWNCKSEKKSLEYEVLVKVLPKIIIKSGLNLSNNSLGQACLHVKRSK